MTARGRSSGFGWRIARTAAVIAIIVFALVSLMLGPLWFTALIPRGTLRSAGILFLRAILVAYPLAGAAALAGTAVLVPLLLHRRRQRKSILGRARWLLLCVVTLIGLLSLELVAAAGASRHVASEPASRTKESPLPRLPDDLAEGPTNEKMLLVLGESTAQGAPYEPWLSVAQIVAWQMEQALPGTQFRVEMWAEPGVSLAQQYDKLTRLARRPDAIIVCSGHNEFQSRFAWFRTAPYYEDERAARRSLGERLAAHSYLCSLVWQTLEHQQVALPPPPVVTRALVDRPTCTRAEYEALRADFHRRLGAIAGFCDRIGALPILIMPACNDGGFDPDRSILAPSTTKRGREAFARAFLAARALEVSDPARSRTLYERLIAEQPSFADAHFRLARLLERSGDWQDARRHYALARDLDAMPMRCPSDFQAAYRAVAKEHPRAILVDSQAIVSSLSAHGIPGDDQFHDAQHPTLLSYIALAQDLLNQLHRCRAFGLTDTSTAPAIDPAECARHFGMDQQKWKRVCEKAALFYKGIAYIRYDPAERLQKMERYEAAAQRIGAGVAPEQAGVAGLGTARGGH